jgi:hypothetical protein
MSSLHARLIPVKRGPIPLLDPNLVSKIWAACRAIGQKKKGLEFLPSLLTAVARWRNAMVS